jgi:recombination protein RecR
MMGDIEHLIHMMSRLPGLGPRSARRAVLYLLEHRHHMMLPLADMMEQTAKSIAHCHICGNLDVADPCHICRDIRRDKDIICVIENVGDLWALERMGHYRGQYHILGGVLSPLEGIGPDDLRIKELLKRLHEADEHHKMELILATNLTVDGQTTAHYITAQIKELANHAHITLSRIAHGVPVGGELDYWDEGTLSAALNARRHID